MIDYKFVAQISNSHRVRSLAVSMSEENIFGIQTEMFGFFLFLGCD